MNRIIELPRRQNDNRLTSTAIIADRERRLHAERKCHSAGRTTSTSRRRWLCRSRANFAARARLLSAERCHRPSTTSERYTGRPTLAMVVDNARLGEETHAFTIVIAAASRSHLLEDCWFDLTGPLRHASSSRAARPAVPLEAGRRLVWHWRRHDGRRSADVRTTGRAPILFSTADSNTDDFSAVEDATAAR